MRPRMAFSSVDLPAPLGPTMPTSAPSLDAEVTRSSTMFLHMRPSGRGLRQHALIDAPPVHAGAACRPGGERPPRGMISAAESPLHERTADSNQSEQGSEIRRAPHGTRQEFTRRQLCCTRDNFLLKNTIPPGAVKIDLGDSGGAALGPAGADTTVGRLRTRGRTGPPAVQDPARPARDKGRPPPWQRAPARRPTQLRPRPRPPAGSGARLPRPCGLQNRTTARRP